jgi:hypothetical protein
VYLRLAHRKEGSYKISQGRIGMFRYMKEDMNMLKAVGGMRDLLPLETAY